MQAFLERGHCKKSENIFSGRKDKLQDSVLIQQSAFNKFGAK
ncbi:hypothetical protein [Desulfonatronum thiodismutans]|nr:hypothetical protein [Desulfonatronum thiodismutans]